MQRKLTQTEIKVLKRKAISGGLFFLCFLVVMYILFQQFHLTWQDVISYTPKNKILAGLVFQLFYALKSLTVFFPLPVLQLAVGHLFSTPWALVINFCGIIVATSIPYWIGHIKGEGAISQLVNHVDAVEKIKAVQTSNVVFSTYIVRMLQLPLDLVSMYLGSEHLPYFSYMLGNLLGLAPVTIAITLLGETITDIHSPVFWQTLGLMVLIIVVSMLIFWRYMKHRPTANKKS